MPNEILLGDCVNVMRGMDDNFVPLTVTSPPYDDMFLKLSHSFDFEAIAEELYRITQRHGGVAVWVVRDQMANSGESLTSFRQALFFQELGFRVQTLVMEKNAMSGMSPWRYGHSPEYAFILIKGDRPRVFNPIREKCKFPDRQATTMPRSRKTGHRKRHETFVRRETRYRREVWRVGSGLHAAEEEWVRAYPHGGIMPERMARDFILSYSIPGDLVFDPMAGLATTCKMAFLLDRFYLGVEIDPEFHAAGLRRMNEVIPKRQGACHD